MKHKALASALIVGLAMVSGVAMAADGTFDNNLTGNWGGARDTMHQHGVDLSLDYLGEFAANPSGGQKHTQTYVDQIHLGAVFDFDRMFGWQGGSLHIDLAQRNGKQLDAKAGLPTLLETQEIYGYGQWGHLVNFYLEQKLWNDKVDLKLGKMSVGTDFFPFSCDFQNLSFCGNLPGYITQGLYNWPIGQLGAVLTVSPTKSFYVKAGTFQINPRNFQHNYRYRLIPGKHNSPMVFGELGWHTNLAGVQGQKLPGTYRIGVWRSSENNPDQLFADDGTLLEPGKTPLMRSHISGSYVMAKQKVTNNVSGGGITVFANWVQGDANTDHTSQIIQAGATWAAPFAARPKDRIGLAVSRNHVSGRYADHARFLNTSGYGPIAVPGNEYAAELNYSANLYRGVDLMPNIQYIRHPGGISHTHGDNATILGLELRVSL